jgi:hypothetical protein
MRNHHTFRIPKKLSASLTILMFSRKVKILKIKISNQSDEFEADERIQHQDNSTKGEIGSQRARVLSKHTNRNCEFMGC